MNHVVRLAIRASIDVNVHGTHSKRAAPQRIRRETDSMKHVSLYDILGVLAPGTVLIVGVITLYPETAAVLLREDFSAGDLGLIVLVSYVAGNLVAALGNFLEWPYWKIFGPRHTERTQRNDDSVLSRRQFVAVEEKLRETGMLRADETIDALSPGDWFRLTRQIHSYVDARKMTERVEVFNAQFGMNRGIAAGFIALIVMLLVEHGLKPWRLELLLAGCALLAFYRMHRFSRHYAQTLFRQFLVVPKEIFPRSEGASEQE